MYNCLPENLTRRDKKMELLQLWKRQKGKDATNYSLLSGIEQCTSDRQLIEVVIQENGLEQEEGGDSSFLLPQAQKIDHLTEVTRADERCTVLEKKVELLEEKVELLQKEIFLQRKNQTSFGHDSIKEVLGDQFCKDTSSSSSQTQSFVVSGDVESCDILTARPGVLYADTVFASATSDAAKKSEKECISNTGTSPVISPARVNPLESTSQVGDWLDAELHIGSKRPYSVIDDAQN